MITSNKVLGYFKILFLRLFFSGRNDKREIVPVLFSFLLLLFTDTTGFVANFFSSLVCCSFFLGLIILELELLAYFQSIFDICNKSQSSTYYSNKIIVYYVCFCYRFFMLEVNRFKFFGFPHFMVY